MLLETVICTPVFQSAAGNLDGAWSLLWAHGGVPALPTTYLPLRKLEMAVEACPGCRYKLVSFAA